MDKHLLLHARQVSTSCEIGFKAVAWSGIRATDLLIPNYQSEIHMSLIRCRLGTAPLLLTCEFCTQSCTQRGPYLRSSELSAIAHVPSKWTQIRSKSWDERGFRNGDHANRSRASADATIIVITRFANPLKTATL